MSYFTPSFFKYLKDLKTHNTRPWFESNRARYEADVKEPMLRFITDLRPGLRKISPHLIADPRPVGGSMFRIHRDMRFPGRPWIEVMSLPGLDIFPYGNIIFR